MLINATAGKISKMMDAHMCTLASVHLVCDMGGMLSLPLRVQLLETTVKLVECCSTLSSQWPQQSVALSEVGGYSTTSLKTTHVNKNVDMVPIQNVGPYVVSQLKGWEAKDQHDAHMSFAACSEEVKQKLQHALNV